jgi:hypothetical protein
MSRSAGLDANSATGGRDAGAAAGCADELGAPVGAVAVGVAAAVRGIVVVADAGDEGVAGV